MGYRSDVLYGIAGPEDQMKAFLVKMRLADPKFTEAIKEMSLVEWGTGELLLYYKEDSVKWYDSYEEVQWHTELWNEAELAYRDGDSEAFANLYGSFVRVGEDDKDLEMHNFGDGNTWEIAQPARSIDSEIDFDAVDIKESLK